MKHEGLKKEVDATLLFFVETDIKIYNNISEKTREAFKVQNVDINSIPDKYKKYLKHS